jgi:hypothetical protein
MARTGADIREIKEIREFKEGAVSLFPKFTKFPTKFSEVAERRGHLGD